MEKRGRTIKGQKKEGRKDAFSYSWWLGLIMYVCIRRGGKDLVIY